MSKNIPLYATGEWEVEPPFKLSEDTTYTAVALVSLNEAEIIYGDAFTIFYDKLDIPLERYLQDKESFVTLVTLTSQNASDIVVPDSFIKSFPSVTAIPYNHVVLSISLGALPDSVGLDDLKMSVSELVQQSLGIVATTKEHQSGFVTKWVPYTTHRVFEANRKALMANNKSIYQQYTEEKNRNTVLQERISILEEMIASKG